MLHGHHSGRSFRVSQLIPLIVSIMTQVFVVYETDAWHTISNRDCKGIYTSKRSAINAIVKNFDIDLDELFESRAMSALTIILRPPSDFSIFFFVKGVFCFTILHLHDVYNPRTTYLRIMSQLTRSSNFLLSEPLESLPSDFLNSFRVSP